MNQTQRGHRLIFVGGAARSGTTLVQNMLDCHPEILGGPEFLHLRDIIRLRKYLLASVDREWIDLYCSRTKIDDELANLIENLLLPLADHHGTRFLSEKTPENVLIFPELAEIFPGSHFIQIIRDPRSVIASMLQVGRRAREKSIKTQNFTHNVNAAIRYIKRCYRAGSKAADLAPGRIMTICYEQLVSQPQKLTQEICRFLDVTWTEQMLSPGEKSHLGEKAITTKSSEIWYNKNKYYSNPDTRHITKWANNLNPFQQTLICRTFKNHPVLVNLGYNLSVDHLSIAARVRSNLLTKAHRALSQVRRKAGACLDFH